MGAKKPMTPEIKAKLREAARRKAERERPLRRVEPWEFLVAIDHAEEAGLLRAATAFDVLDAKHCRLKFVTPEQEEALNSRLAFAIRSYTRRCWTRAERGEVETVKCYVWDYAVIAHILDFLRVKKPATYIRWWRPVRKQ